MSSRRIEKGLPAIPEVDTGTVIQRKIIAFTAFQKQIPEEFVEVVGPFIGHQWSVLKSLHRLETMRDLAAANPVLAISLPNSGEFRRCRARGEAAESLVDHHSHSKQRDILRWLGFPGTPAMAKLFRKIDPVAVTPFLLRCVRAAVEDHEAPVKQLAHQKRIGAGVLAWASYPSVRELATFHMQRTLVTIL